MEVSFVFGCWTQRAEMTALPRPGDTIKLSFNQDKSKFKFELLVESITFEEIILSFWEKIFTPTIVLVRKPDV